jgi:hypothetical protein
LSHLPTIKRSGANQNQCHTQLTHTLHRSLYLLFVPVSLSFDYSLNCVPLVDSFGDLRNLWSLLTYSGLTYFLAWSVWQWPHNLIGVSPSSEDDMDDVEAVDHNREFLVMSFCLFAVPFFFSSGTLLAESALYVPSIGFCLLLAFFLHLGYERKIYSSKVFFCLCLALLLFYSASTYQRNSVWDSEFTLYQR